MWRSIFHDTENDRMYVWYTDGTMDAVPSVHEFYTDKQGEYGAKPCGMRDIWDREVFKVEVPPANGVSAYEVEKVIKQNHAGPTNHLAEIDIDPRGRFLQKHYADTGVIHPDMKDINLGFLDIENATTGRFSLPTEAKYPINVVTFYVSKQDKYYVYGVAKDISEKGKQFLKDNKGEYILCKDEADLLTQLLYCIGSSDIDILSGWNFGFDTVYICNRLKQVNEKLPPKDRISLDLLSRMRGKNKRAYLNPKNELIINGTEVIDFLELYKKYTFSEESSYKLDHIGKKIVGESKAPLPDGYLSWQKYWEDYVLYNFQDVRLLVKIEAKAQMFRLAVTSAAAARVPFSSVFSSKKMLTGFMLDHLHHTNRTFPPYRQQHKEVFPGAFVYSVPGYKEYLVSYDYRSLYPSIMMTFNTSPEMKVTFPIDYVLTEEEKKNLIKSPWDHNGRYQVYFRKDKIGVVPEVTRLLFDGRSDLKKLMKKAKKAGDKEMAGVYDMMQKVYKVLGNSLYGLLGSNFFPFYDVDNAASITGYGQRLIKFTIAELAKYLNEELVNDQRFYDAFGYKPQIDPSFLGTTKDDDGQVLYRRMSHGDTDSFYCKIGDIYKPFGAKAGTGVEVIVFDGHKEIFRQGFDNDHILESKKMFNAACNQYLHDVWHDPENRSVDKKTGLTKVQIMFHDGLVMGKRYRVIYNRFRLTDFCRIMDAAMLEEKLDEFMLAYAKKWNFLTNELFLKREKCIYKAIVTAKKKYICEAESNEDIVYLDLGHKDEDGKWVPGTLELEPHFAITGLEIVRSSTTLFSRERMLDMVKLMLKTMDRDEVRRRLLVMKKEFFEAVNAGNYSYIACPSGMKEEPLPYLKMITMPRSEIKDIDWRRRAASVWNYLIENDPVLAQEPYEPIYAGDKMKFIKKADDRYGVSIICYSGEKCPERLLQLFHADWEEQWHVSVAQILGRLFEAVGWPKELEYDQTKKVRAFG